MILNILSIYTEYIEYIEYTEYIELIIQNGFVNTVNISVYKVIIYTTGQGFFCVWQTMEFKLCSLRIY